MYSLNLGGVVRKEGLVEQRKFQNSRQLDPLPRVYNDGLYIEVVDNAYGIIVTCFFYHA